MSKYLNKHGITECEALEELEPTISAIIKELISCCNHVEERAISYNLINFINCLIYC
jgi:hypothetical protein